MTDAGCQVAGSPVSPPDVPLTFVAQDVGLLGPMEVPFLRRPDGSVGWLSMGFRIVPKSDA